MVPVRSGDERLWALELIYGVKPDRSGSQRRIVDERRGRVVDRLVQQRMRIEGVVDEQRDVETMHHDPGAQIEQVGRGIDLARGRIIEAPGDLKLKGPVFLLWTTSCARR